MIPAPPYAYIPGQTPRHDEALFAGFGTSVGGGDLTQSLAWRAGLRYLERGFFWEAHEAFEPVWMATLPNSAERHMVQALIQFANASLKAKMQRPKAVLRLCDIADEHLSFCKRTTMGLETHTWIRSVQKLRFSAEQIYAI